MREALRRRFVVDCPVEQAWDLLTHPEDWPETWATHLRRVQTEPHGELTDSTTGTMRMQNGFKARMTMEEFRPGVNWKWTGRSRFSPTTTFDHRFERIDEGHTALEFIVWTRGFGRLGSWATGRILGRALDRSIPRLVGRLDASSSTRQEKKRGGRE